MVRNHQKKEFKLTKKTFSFKSDLLVRARARLLGDLIFGDLGYWAPPRFYVVIKTSHHFHQCSEFENLCRLKRVIMKTLKY